MDAQLKLDLLPSSEFDLSGMLVAVVQGVSQPSLRVLRYRGSGCDEDESPFLIGKSGVAVIDARMLTRITTIAA